MASKLLTLLGGSFNPLIYSPALWLDAADKSTLFQDSGLTTPVASTADPVGGWKDKSGNGRHVTQVTAGARPTWVTGQQNGLPGLQGDGVDDYLRMTGISIPYPYTIFCVAKIISAGTGTRVVYDGATVNEFSLRRASGSVNVSTLNFLPIIPATGLIDSTHIFTPLANGTQSYFIVDNVPRVSPVTNNSVITITGFTVFAAGNIAEFFNGQIYEMLVIPKLLTFDDISKFSRYLGNKWGITVA